MTKLSEHFSREEFACQCGCGQDSVDYQLIRVLEALRQHTGPIIVSSGNRCTKRNKASGGALKSYHVISKAADIIVRSHTPAEIYHWLNERYPDLFGIGLYSGWVHIDVRSGPKARWHENHS
jgi:uncharacterized protein YcbK (DUF882 family)